MKQAAEGGIAMGTIRENKEIFRLFHVEGLAGDLTLLDEITLSDVVVHDGDGSARVGRDAVKQDSADLVHGFPDLSVHVEQVIGQEDMVAGRVVLRGTNSGEYRGVPPSGRQVEFTGLAEARIDGHQVAEMWLAIDRLSLMRQLGALPPMMAEVRP